MAILGTISQQASNLGSIINFADSLFQKQVTIKKADGKDGEVFFNVRNSESLTGQNWIPRDRVEGGKRWRVRS